MPLNNDRAVSRKIEDPATLQVGTSSAALLRDIIAGQGSFDFSAGVLANGSASASAAITGLTTSHRAVAKFVSSAFLGIAGVSCGAGAVTVTATNPSTANRSGSAAELFNYFTWRNG